MHNKRASYRANLSWIGRRNSYTFLDACNKNKFQFQQRAVFFCNRNHEAGGKQVLKKSEQKPRLAEGQICTRFTFPSVNWNPVYLASHTASMSSIIDKNNSVGCARHVLDHQLLECLEITLDATDGNQDHKTNLQCLSNRRREKPIQDLFMNHET